MDKYVNVTNLDSVLDGALEIIEFDKNASSFQKTCCKMSVEYAKEILKRAIAAGGEFRPVIHAHWIEHEADFGESLYCECSNCHDSTGIDCTQFCGACGAIMDEPTIKVQDC